MTNPADYIFPNHFIQLIGYMEIFDKEFIDYCVYSSDEGLLKMIRVYRDKKYWNEIIYPGLLSFMHEHLKWETDDGF